jgi:hypothetical protein
MSEDSRHDGRTVVYLPVSGGGGRILGLVPHQKRLQTGRYYVDYKNGQIATRLVRDLSNAFIVEDFPKMGLASENL